MKTQIVNLNMRRLGNSQKRSACFEWLIQIQYDILMLQEVHCNDQIKAKWKDEWGGQCIFSGNNSLNEGVAILINHKGAIYKENV